MLFFSNFFFSNFTSKAKGVQVGKIVVNYINKAEGILEYEYEAKEELLFTILIKRDRMKDNG